MVALWHHSEEPFSVPGGTFMFLCVDMKVTGRLKMAFCIYTSKEKIFIIHLMFILQPCVPGYVVPGPWRNDLWLRGPGALEERSMATWSRGPGGQSCFSKQYSYIKKKFVGVPAPSSRKKKKHPKKTTSDHGVQASVTRWDDRHTTTFSDVLTRSSLFRVERFTRANEMPAFRAVRVWEGSEERKGEIMKRDEAAIDMGYTYIFIYLYIREKTLAKSQESR